METWVMRGHLNNLALALCIGATTLAHAEPASSPATENRAPITLSLSADGNWLSAVEHLTPTEQTYVVAPAQPAPMGVVSYGEAGTIGVAGERVVWSIPLDTSAAAATPPWCDRLVGLNAVGSMGVECVRALASAGDMQPRVQRTQLQSTYVRGPWSVGLAYLAQDQVRDAALGANLAPLGDGLPQIATSNWRAPSLPQPWLFGEGRDVGVLGSWRLDAATALTWSASLGQWSLPPVLNSITFDQAAFQVGLTYGAFTGGITGRVMRPEHGAENGGEWSGLDIGVSWRTPWQAELSFGAQNLISRGNANLLPDATDAAIDEVTARTPYVRYKQDL
jgi:hypothetical protein